MMRRELAATGEDSLDVDWFGNNAAFTCPLCHKVFIVSGMFHKEGRECPNCKRSRGFVRGGRVKEGVAFIEWDVNEPSESPSST
jgi:hypothetical protein